MYFKKVKLSSQIGFVVGQKPGHQIGSLGLVPQKKSDTFRKNQKILKDSVIGTGLIDVRRNVE